MKQLFIIANWKSNKTTEEAKAWLKTFQNGYHLEDDQKEVIICPPSLLIPLVKQYQNNVTSSNSGFKLGLQDFSPFEKGAYTGEEPAALAKEFVDYAIIGHSERRTYLKEGTELLAQKVATAQQLNITPIFCIQDEHTPIPRTVSIVAYEPVNAISTSGPNSHPDTPEDADKVADIIKTAYANVKYILYGGSVVSENVKKFTQLEHIDGVLVGGASLDPLKFLNIIENA